MRSVDWKDGWISADVCYEILNRVGSIPSGVSNVPAESTAS